MELNKLSGRLKWAMEHAGYTQAKLADKAGVTQPSISFIMRGKTEESKYTKKFADILGVEFDWLSKGVGPPVLLSGSIKVKKSWHVPFFSISDLNKYNNIQEALMDTQSIKYAMTISEIDIPGVTRENTFVVECEDSSMSPKCPSGTKLVICQSLIPRPEQMVLCKISYNQSITIRQFRLPQNNNNGYILRAINEAYGQETITNDSNLSRVWGVAAYEMRSLL